MVATVNGKSANLAYLDATDLTVAANAVAPMARLTAGEGAPGHLRIAEDIIPLDAAGLADTGSYYRGCRIPSNAKVKRVTVFSDSVLDSNGTSLLQLTFGVGWSDANDGTPSSFQGKNPAAAKNGTNTAATTNNALFGTISKVPTANTAIPVTDITFNGNLATYPVATVQQQPLEKVFGYVNPQGYDQHGLGFMDIVVNVAAAAATAVAGNLFVRVEYVV